MKNIKKLVLLIVFTLFILGTGLNAYAGEEEHTALADYLKEMGLFQGTDTGYDLEGKTTRVQAAVMIVRLLGKEELAKQQNFGHPFTDVPQWANPYVGYLWKMDLSRGISPTLFGADDLLNEEQYMTFLLRVLDYDDAQGDFIWSQSLDRAYELGILTEQDYQVYGATETFLRDDLVFFTFKALWGNMKNGNGKSLLRQLIDEQVVPQRAMLAYKYAPYLASADYSQPETIKEFQSAVIQGIVGYKATIDLDLSKIKVTDIETMVNDALDLLRTLPAYASVIKGWSSRTLNNQMALTFHYMITKEQFDKTILKANEVAKNFIGKSYTDYDKELLIHDYIVDNTQYYIGDDDPNEIYTMYGLLINQKAVCQGYADAFYYFTTYAGIETQLVYGDGVSDKGSELHAWNVIELDGEHYFVDTTWDDPVSASGEAIKVYSYFNVTSEEMSEDHIWVKENYPVSIANTYNYFIYNELVVEGEQGLKIALSEDFNQRKTDMMFKVMNASINNDQLRVILDSVVTGNVSYFYSADEESGMIYVTDIEYR